MKKAISTAGNKTMKRATKGMVAGALGIGLLSSGATFALWDDAAGGEATTITSGSLAVSTSEEGPSWYDISADVEGTPTPIDPETFLMVPGDTIRMTQDVHIDLTGTNMQATATVTAPALTGELAEDVSGTYAMSFDAPDRGKITFLRGDVNGSSPAPFTITPHDGTKGNTGNQEDYQVEIVLTYDPLVEGPGVTAQAVLDGLALKLEQVR